VVKLTQTDEMLSVAYQYVILPLKLYHPS